MLCLFIIIIILGLCVNDDIGIIVIGYLGGITLSSITSSYHCQVNTTVVEELKEEEVEFKGISSCVRKKGVDKNILGERHYDMYVVHKNHQHAGQWVVHTVV